MFDLRFDFVGDFSLQPTRIDSKGAYGKEEIYQPLFSRVTGFAPSCFANQTQKEIDAAKAELRHAARQVAASFESLLEFRVRRV